MDPSAPDLRRLSRALAANNMRVLHFLDGLVTRVDDVVEATFSRDWEQVGQISHLIARFSQLRGFSAIAQSAVAVSEEAEGPCDENELRRRVLSLISECGKARKEQRVSANDSLAN